MKKFLVRSKFIVLRSREDDEDEAAAEVDDEEDEDEDEDVQAESEEDEEVNCCSLNLQNNYPHLIFFAWRVRG